MDHFNLHLIQWADCLIPFYKITKIVIFQKACKSQPLARDLQAFLVCSQHPAWFITPVNP